MVSKLHDPRHHCIQHGLSIGDKVLRVSYTGNFSAATVPNPDDGTSLHLTPDDFNVTRKLVLWEALLQAYFNE